MRHAWRFSLLVFPLTGLVWGCSGDDAVTVNGPPGVAADDGGAEATTGDEGGGGPETGSGTDAGVDTSTPLSCPAYTGSDPYCKSLSDYCGRCAGQISACEIQNIANCEQLSQIFSS